MLAVRAPQSKPASDRLLDLERIHQGDDVDGERRRLAVADRVARQKARRAIAAQIRDDHAIARRGQHGRDIDKAVNVVGPAVQKNDRRAIGRAGFGVADIQDAGIDLLERAERRVRSRLDRGQPRSFGPAGLCVPQDRIMPSCAAATVMAAAPKKRRRCRLISSAILIVFIGESPWFDGYAADQPNVNAKASTPEPRNSISNCRSAMGFGCRISWYSRCSVTVPLPCSSTSIP